MAKPTNSSANKTRGGVRGKAPGGHSPARNDGGGRLKPVAVAAPTKASTPAVEKAQEADVHSIELLEARRKPMPTAANTGPGGSYVYGVIESAASKEPIHFGRTRMGGFGEQVYSVHHGDIAAVVSKTSAFIFDPPHQNPLPHNNLITTTFNTH